MVPGDQPAAVAPDGVTRRNKTTSAKMGTQAKRSRKAGKVPRKPRSAAGVREGSKTTKLLALLQQAKGATLKELIKATGWQAHSIRGFISGVLEKRLGLAVESSKREDGRRLYKVVR